MSSVPERLAFLGGTGPEGRGLAHRFARAGHPVVIGSRTEERARAAAEEVRDRVPEADIEGRTNVDAAAYADISVVTLPYGALGTLSELRDALRAKLVVSAVAPLEFVEGRLRPVSPAAGSAAQEVLSLIPESIVASAFQSLDARTLWGEGDLDSDVIVCSDDADARHRVMDLTAALPGVRALSGGRLAASRYVEETTGLLITINRIYKVHSGFRLTGLKR